MRHRHIFAITAAAVIFTMILIASNGTAGPSMVLDTYPQATPVDPDDDYVQWLVARLIEVLIAILRSILNG